MVQILINKKKNYNIFATNETYKLISPVAQFAVELKSCGSAGERGVVKAEYLETCRVYAFHECPAALSLAMMSP